MQQKSTNDSPRNICSFSIDEVSLIKKTNDQFLHLLLFDFSLCNWHSVYDNFKATVIWIISFFFLCVCDYFLMRKYSSIFIEYLYENEILTYFKTKLKLRKENLCIKYWNHEYCWNTNIIVLYIVEGNLCFQRCYMYIRSIDWSSVLFSFSFRIVCWINTSLNGRS
jgi:hypothetical protein